MDANSPPSLGSPWFAVSMGLLGVIVGYGIANVQTGWALQRPAGAPTAQVAPDAAPQPSPPSAPVAPVDPSTDHVRGNPNAKITLIEYSDFECPFCQRHAGTIDQVLKEYGDSVNVVYRHFPLSFHQNAQKEAEASECVAELGGNDAFWTFHDEIFKRSTTGGTGFPLDKLAPLAKELGVNEAKFTACLDGGTYAAKVQEQMQSGIAAGVQGTPGNFVVNNETQEQKEVSGAVPFATFKSIIEEML